MIKDSITLSKEIRKCSLRMVYQAKASHIGGALSMVDLLSVLYSTILKYDVSNPSWEERDRFILSKGHACVSFYYIPGIEISAGSLGHGLPIACGIALAAKRRGQKYRTYVIVGDGEMDEGSNWEALLLASHLELDNLCLIIDYNKIQSLGATNEVLNLEPFKSKLEAFNWNVIQIDGHNHEAIRRAFIQAEAFLGKPTAIIADTIKGKGVSFMENELLWHYKSPDEKQYNQAIKEIEG